MFESPPREKQWLSWLYVVIWALIIFVTIPLAAAIQEFVYQQWSRDVFTYVVVATTAVAFVAATIYARRFRLASRSSYFWLAAVAAIFLGYTIALAKQSPEEAIHFIEYGVLGILVYRALTHTLHDMSIYFAAAIVCGIIGTVDEFIQWLIPQRVWGLRDIWMNFFSSALVQIAIARGLKPTFIASLPGRTNLRFLCRLAIAAIAIFGASLLNTPARIAWVAERIPWFEFLKGNESVMLEYGYLYEDSDIGIFRSRFAPAELEQMDCEQARETANILNRFQDRSSYQEFLKIYTPISDPFVHEARVHLFRRDVYFEAAAKYRNDPKRYAWHLTVAFRENQIMEKYFSNTLQHSAYIWSEDTLALARNHLLQEEIYDSGVSSSLITRVSEGQVASFFIVLILGLALVHWYLGKAQ